MEVIIAFLIYGVIFAAVIWLGVLLYMRSVSSRKYYTCEKCGEKQRVEHMQASRCSTCGAPLATPTN